MGPGQQSCHSSAPGQEFQPLAELLSHLGTWLANVWAAGSKDIPFPAAWDRLKDPVFWRRHLTVAFPDQARDGLGTVQAKYRVFCHSFAQGGQITWPCEV